MADNGLTLAAQFALLQAERDRSWSPEALKVNSDQRRLLVERYGDVRRVSVGDLIDPFALIDAEGHEITFPALVANAPAVLIFFRFAGCPACNIVLPYYDRRLAPALAARGVSLVGISPQRPDRLVEIKTKHNLSFAIATDRGNGLARRLGLTYEFDEPSKQAAIARGQPIGEVTGTGTWELPMPAVIVVDQARRVRFADVSPDWLARTEAETIIAAFDDIAGTSSASARNAA